MWRPKIKNRAFDRMGERYAPFIDPDHFLGRSAFDIHRKKEEKIPPVNIRHDGKIFDLELAVPGFKKDEIHITVKDAILTIRGEKSKKESAAKSKYIIEEFEFDSFKRSFRLVSEVACEKINAKYKNGILTLTFIDVPVEEEKSYQEVEVM